MIAEEQKLKGTLSGGQSLAGSMKDIPSVDKTLTKEGYAADSKAVGDALATKAEEIHQHTKEDITDFPTSLPASDVYSWAKQPQKPSYSASEVKARPDNWMPTAEQVGAAPSGYGYGETMPIMNYTESELEQWFSSIIAGMPNLSTKQVAFYCKDGTLSGMGGFYATIYKYDASNANVVGRVYYNGYTVHKNLYDGVWQPFEWANPPMVLGVEYRTTERAFGKAIYKRVNEYGEIGFRLEGSQQEKDDTWEYGPIGGAIYGPFRHHGYFYIDNNEVLQLGYIDPLKTTNGEFASMVLLLSSNFYRNMHGSSHIVHIRADDSGSDGNMNIAVSVGMNTTYNSPRTFYYKYDADAGRLYLYVLASGGNGFGRWNVTALQDSGNIRWNPEFVESPSLDGLIEVN